MTAEMTTEEHRRSEMLLQARVAVSVLRDAVRVGRVIDFRERDSLVIAIHDALDLLVPSSTNPQPASVGDAVPDAEAEESCSREKASS